MGLFDEIEQQAEEAVRDQGLLGNPPADAEAAADRRNGIQNLRNEVEKALGGRNAEHGKVIDPDTGLHNAEGNRER